MPRAWLAAAMLSAAASAAGSGCVRQIRTYNPYPELHTVAVAPFFNLSHQPAVDGRRVAAAYYAELQRVPGFEAVPVGVVETAMREYGIELADPAEAARLAQLLEVDAVVIGAITDFDPYYPPRLALQVEWYPAATYPAAPVMRYTRLFDGADEALVEQLQDYVVLRTDERAGMWHGYLQRSDDFIRFCCHRMIYEMLVSYAGADESRLVLRVPEFR